VSIEAESVPPPPTEAAEGVVRHGAPRSKKSVKRRRRAMTKRRGKLSERITLTMIVGTLALLLAFVSVIAVLSDRREMVEVIVPSVRIPAGAVISADNVEIIEMPAAVSFSDDLLGQDRLAEDLVAGRTLEVGEPIGASAIGEGSSRPVGRSMAIPISSWGVTGGELEVGDEIDVIDTRDEGAIYVMTGAVVIDRSSDGGGSGGLSATRNELWVAIEVTRDDALRLAAVIEADEFLIVRSTGLNDTTVDPAAPTEDGE